MMRALFSGISGLKNHQVRVDVIGNNIANVNTTGYKKSRVIFSDILSQTVQSGSAPSESTGGVNSKQIGIGMSISAIDQIMTQGAFQSTGKTSDISINGDGYFVVKDGDKSLYTRAGNFSIDGLGYLVHPGTGNRVQGWVAEKDPQTGENLVNTAKSLDAINFRPGEKLPAKATAEIQYRCNLTSTAPERSYPLNGVAGTFLDGQGNSRTVKMEYQDVSSPYEKSIGKKVITWKSRMDIDSGRGEEEFAEGKVTFDSDGRIEASTIKQIADDPLSPGIVEGIASGETPWIYSEKNETAVTVNVPFGSTNEIVFKAPEVNPATGKFEFIGYGSFPSSTKGGGDDYNSSILDQSLDVKHGQYAFEQEEYAVSSTSPVLIKNKGLNIDNIVIKDKNGNIFANGADYNVVNSAGSASGREYEIQIPAGSTIPDGSLIYASYEMQDPDYGTFFSFNGAIEGGNHATSIMTYDTRGGKHTVKMHYEKISENLWQYKTYLAEDDPLIQKYLREHDIAQEIGSKPNSFELELANDWAFRQDGLGSERLRDDEMEGSNRIGKLAFNILGEVDYEKTRTINKTPNLLGKSLRFRPDGANELEIDLDLGGITQFDSPMTTSARSQNGFDMGTLESFSLDKYGNVTGIYSNGYKQTIAQLSLATFSNSSGLEKQGDSMFQASSNSGVPLIGQPGQAKRGTIVSGTLEMSNVDLAEEFTDLIIAQRGFSANSKIITTSDQILSELVALKR